MEDTRQLYNAALEEWREAWRMGRHKVTFYSQDVQLKDIGLRTRRGTAAGPLPASGPRVPALLRPRQGRSEARISQVQRLRLVGFDRMAREERRALGLCSAPDSYPRLPPGHRSRPRPPAPVGSAVGIDLGVASFLTISDGRHVPNPRHLAASTERLTAAQRDLARKKRGSTRRRKAIAKVARLHGKVRRQRLDNAHTTALALVRDHDLIVHEDLRITNMVRRPEPRPDGDGGYLPNGATAKAGLNKSIHDARLGIFLRVLSAKAESAGRHVTAVNSRHTSQRCAECAHVAAGNRVTQAEFRCLACGHQAHADVNAARNILRAGLALQEA